MSVVEVVRARVAAAAVDEDDEQLLLQALGIAPRRARAGARMGGPPLLAVGRCRKGRHEIRSEADVVSTGKRSTCRACRNERERESRRCAR